MSAQQFDPLALPLQGQQLIEASAGTGKTFNLTGLYLRLIIERDASVRDILVMTFTKAATQELRDRIRRRLVDAAHIAANRNTATPGNPEHDFVCAVLDLSSAAPGVMTRRLRTAATAIDEASIVTIHGFAQRATRDNAFDSAIAFDRGDNVDDTAVFAEAATDLWRSAIYGHDARPELLDIWPTPQALEKAIKPILRRPGLQIDGADASVLQQALANLQPQWDNNRNALIAALDNAVEHDAFKKSDMKELLVDYESPSALVEVLDKRLQSAFSDKQPSVLPEGLAELASPNAFISGGSNAKKACAEPFHEIPSLEPLAALVSVARVALIATTAQTIRDMAEARKREHRQFSYDDLVLGLHAALTQPEQGQRLAAKLRAQWPYALVDEFQDTDPLQYACLQRIYLDTPDDADPAATALLLIGDPKQAIYAFRGGDIYAYLAAARAAQANKYTLNRNFRSAEPLLDAIAALYNWPADRPFLEQGIDFPPVSAGSEPRQLMRADGDGKTTPHPALTLWQFTGGQGTKTDDDKYIVRRTVATIAGLLSGEAVWDNPDDNGDTAIKPQHIAVLVNSNYQAATIQSALARHGIAAVCQRRDSVFATEQAEELTLLLAATAQPDNQAAVRSAETTLLAGAGLSDIIALADDDNAMQACIARYQQHFQHWQRRGVLAALEPLFVAAAPRILALADGERRMSNYLQLGERLAVAETESYGMGGLRHWLEREIEATAEVDNASSEEAQLRLESDDALVRIATLHSAKGLEYPIVFMPYAMYLGAPSQHRNPAKAPHIYHAPDSNTPDQVHIDLTGASADARQRAVLEAQSESLRLLYVGLTRAATALFISWREPGDGESKTAGSGSKGSALEHLLGRNSSVMDAFSKITEQQPDTVAIETVNVDADAPAIATLAKQTTVNLGTGRTDLPAARPRWSTYSFSRLAHAAPASDYTTLPEPGAEDEIADTGSNTTQPATTPDSIAELLQLDRSLAGVRFGSAVHDILESWVGNTERTSWPAPGQPCADEHLQFTQARLRQYGLIGDDAKDERIRQTAELIARTLHTPLPKLGPLAELQPQSVRTEMGFMLRLGGNRLNTIIGTLRDAGYLPAALGGHPAQTLYGLMQGFIDVVVEHKGSYFILDYKTNRLGDTATAYASEELKRAIGQAHYDLQYLIYTVALHRHLKLNLGEGYDINKHLGGVQYLFVRALDGQSNNGVSCDIIDPALVETLDILFDAPAESV